MIEKMCVGFLFSEDRQFVVLIKKTHPEWQKGKLNGIGGKLKPNETQMEAMVREFQEEAGVVVSNWQEYCKLQGDSYLVYFFRAFGNVTNVKAMTDEKIVVLPVDGWQKHPYVINLGYLIPMALSRTPIVANITEM